MKKLLFTLLLSIFLIPNVNADTIVEVSEQEFIQVNTIRYNGSCSNYSGLYYYSNFDKFISTSNYKEIFERLYTELMDKYYNDLQSTYPYYSLSVDIISTNSNYLELKILTLYLSVYETVNGNGQSTHYSNSYNSNTLYTGIRQSMVACSDTELSIIHQPTPLYNKGSTWYYLPLAKFESNLQNFIGSTEDSGLITFKVYDSEFNLKNTYDSYDIQPTYLSGTYNDYISSVYTEVNLDNYEYVILNLKDYSSSESFETNLQVKGSVGITPIYNFGQAEKSEVTDRCNLSYSDFTDYRFFILKNDLTNNVFYIVKECEENSSFRFDSNVFDITYVTTENVDDPVVTFGGVDYHTIPFNKLSNSANQNEQNNFIPGESGSSLTDIIDNVSNFTSDIWNAISSFMGLVTKFFNTLPEEFRYLSITSFTVLTVIAIIKFIRG